MARIRGTTFLKALDPRPAWPERVIPSALRAERRFTELAHIHLPTLDACRDEVQARIVANLSVGEYERVTEAYELAKRNHEPEAERSDVRNAVAGAFLFLGKMGRAESLLLELRKEIVKDGTKGLMAAVLNNLAGIHYQRGELKEALSLVEESLEVNPSTCTAYVNLLDIKARMWGTDLKDDEVEKALMRLNKNAPHWPKVDGFIAALLSDSALQGDVAQRPVFQEAVRTALDSLGRD